MKKLGLIALSLLTALASLGINQAKWTDALTMNGILVTAAPYRQVRFLQAVTNDDGSAGNSLDPNNQGSWSWTIGTLSHTNWLGTRTCSNEASTTVSGTGSQRLTVTLNNTPNKYWSSVGFTIKNNGDSPITITAINTAYSPSGTDGRLTVTYGDILSGLPQTIIAGQEKLGTIFCCRKDNAFGFNNITLNITFTYR